MAEKTGFRINNKRILLTYPHTSNTPKELLEKFFDVVSKENIEYAIACVEHHKDQELHNHLFVMFRKAYSSRNERCFDLDGRHPNITTIRVTPWKTVEYCKKEGEWEEYLPENRPRLSYDSMTRTERYKFLKEHDPLELVEQDQISEIQAERMIKARLFLNDFKKHKLIKPKPIVIWIHGKTGKGKSYLAASICEEIAEANNWDTYTTKDETLKWWNGYHGQELVIIEEFRKHGVSYSFFLRLLDRYYMSVQTKGGFTEFNPKIIFITAPVGPKEAFQWLDKDGELQDWDGIEQLLRRIDDVIDFDKF